MQRNPSVRFTDEKYTAREIEILSLMAEGCSNQDIAHKLFLSLGTVKWYNNQLFSKLGVANRIQAISKARQAGIFNPSCVSNILPTPVLKNNLPVALTSFIGRTKDLEAITNLLRSPATRLATIVGSGGIGKTRLALETANHLGNNIKDGVWWIDLSAIQDPDFTAQQVINSLGWQNERNLPPATFLVQGLKYKTCLLLLDNCEHLLPACANLVTTLLENCPNIKFLATSRASLGVEGEFVYLISPLTYPDPNNLPPLEEFQSFEAVQLFHERVQRVLPGFTIQPENMAPIAFICQRLDGFPLGLELVAVHANQVSLQQMNELIEQRLWFLTTNPQSHIPRHHSLQACLDWSYSLLTEAERTLFRRLAIFSGGWTIEAVENIAGLQVDESSACKPAIIDDLTRLVQKSLVNANLSQMDNPRYGFHAIVRQYALEKLIESDELAWLSHHHLLYYLDLLTQLYPKFISSGRLAAILQCQTELENIRKALTFAYQQTSPEIIEAGLRLATLMREIWILFCLYTEGSDWVNIGMQRLGDRLKSNHALSGAALDTLGRTAFFLGKLPEYEFFFTESIRHYRICQDNAGLLDSLRCLGCTLVVLDPVRAKPILDEAIELAQHCQDGWMLANSLFWRGLLVFTTGDSLQAEEYYRQSLAYCQKTGDPTFSCYPTITLALVACARDDPEQARFYLEKYLLFSRDTPEKNLYLFSYGFVYQVAYYLGDFNLLAAYAQEMTVFYNHYIQAEIHFCLSMRMLGLAFKHQDNYDRAMACYLEAFEYAYHRQELGWMVAALAGLGGIAAWLGQSWRAAILLGAVQAANEKQAKAAPLPEGVTGLLKPVEQTEFERDLTRLKTQLDPDILAVAWNKGRAMSIERAILEAYKIKPN